MKMFIGSFPNPQNEAMGDRGGMKDGVGWRIPQTHKGRTSCLPISGDTEENQERDENSKNPAKEDCSWGRGWTELFDAKLISQCILHSDAALKI